MFCYICNNIKLITYKLKQMENVRITPEMEEKVKAYVYAKYKSLEGKNLIIRDKGTFYSILKHKDGTPLFLGKDIF